MRLFFLTSAVFLAIAVPCRADTLQVGPGRTYATVRAAILAAGDGDVIEIDAGTYRGDVATVSANGLTIRGVGGYAHLDADGEDEGGKGIWVVMGNGLVVEDVEFSGAAVNDENGAGIRLEGQGLTLRRCRFHDNENGILAGDRVGSAIVIEDSEFRDNGFGDGYTHNLYVNHVDSLTVTGSWFHHARIGHELKSRARTTILRGNRFSNDGDGTASYEVDVPNGGLVVLVGNVIQQAATGDNPTLLSFGEEGADNPMQALYLVNNTFVNDRPQGGTFVHVEGADTVVFANNLYVGAGTQLSGTASAMGELRTDAPGFLDRAGFDYHLATGSPAIDVGVASGGAGVSMYPPTIQHTFPLGSATRSQVGVALDVGAFEFGDTHGMNGPTGRGTPGSPTDDGCSCSAAGATRASTAPFAILALALLVAQRRRRRV